ncbi:flotillin family protein [Gallaecimonas pentaromativorans]|uniref:Flotillin n=1 Tax=Gallaecimonas pentaromativorans TaxID=584787 RepID=A0A3N1NU05_9GAMM|nr:flotillin family protein [Gallaecimonas pentaromativorans]MED5526008.1 flotillin family protein [Pseudomonadota bacterium]ROQ18941.1 flotillin [Gallaecimonas pentaromativorans]
MENLDFILMVAGAVVAGLLFIGLIFTKLYHRASKEVAFVRTGMGGEKVVKDGGTLVLPVLQEVINVNMNTLRLEVRRANEAALITRDRMRVDVTAEFYVRVAPTVEAISVAAQTLGNRTLEVDALKSLIEGKFVDVLRAVAAEMAMEELHEKRSDFVQRVQNNVRVDLEKNGLELESVSLTGLDQTDPKFFRVDNAFDAEGLTQLTKITESRRKQRNDIERETEVQIQERNLETEQRSLAIKRESEYARLQQEKEVELRRAAQTTDIAKERADKNREAELVTIEADRAIEEARIAKEREVEAREIDKRRQLEEAEIVRKRTLELAEQEKAIALARKSEEESAARAKASEAEALSVAAQENVRTVQETAVAERDKQIEIIEASKAAEMDAVKIRVAAETEKAAAEDRAEALLTEAKANAEKAEIEAQAEAAAEKTRADAKAKSYEVEAAGQRALHEASNVLSPEQVEMQLKLALYKYLPDIIRESVKPLENIDGIKIVQMDGFAGQASGHGDDKREGGSGNLADSVTEAALRYRTQAPLVDALLGEIGLKDGITKLDKLNS